MLDSAQGVPSPVTFAGLRQHLHSLGWCLEVVVRRNSLCVCLESHLVPVCAWWEVGKLPQAHREDALNPHSGRRGSGARMVPCSGLSHLLVLLGPAHSGPEQKGDERASSELPGALPR